MSRDVLIAGDYLITPLGAGTALNFRKVMEGKSAVKQAYLPEMAEHPLFLARIDEGLLPPLLRDDERYTRLEKFFIAALEALIAEHDIPKDGRTLVLLSTTKGNISLLNNPRGGFPEERIYLSTMAEVIRRRIGFENPVIPLSNACISGALALTVAGQLMQSGRYEHAVVVGGDEISRFIVSGFHAFQALADAPCRPFDRDRNGLNLGEAVAAAYLTRIPKPDTVRILATGSFNDANHISGPSRTGEGLYRSIRAAMAEADSPAIDFISAHGTATRYNDDMESIALHRCGLTAVPLHSLKGYYGHTLGASGLLETILGIHSLKTGRLIPSLGFVQEGTTHPLNIIRQATAERPLRTFLKTASGFGGCNIATVFQQTGQHG